MMKFNDFKEKLWKIILYLANKVNYYSARLVIYSKTKIKRRPGRPLKLDSIVVSMKRKGTKAKTNDKSANKKKQAR